MAIERKELAEGEQNNRPEEELKNLREQARREELEKVKAQAELDLIRRQEQERVRQSLSAPPAAHIPTEEEWTRAEAETGMTRQQIIAQAQLAGSMIENQTRQLRTEIDEAKKRAKEAEDRLGRFESRNTVSQTEKEFFDSKPYLQHYRRDIQEFIDLFPESERNDPQKMRTILEKSETYLKGKVREMRKPVSNESSQRFSSATEEFEDEETGRSKIDFSGLDKISAKRLISDINDEAENKLRDKEKADRFKKYSSSDGLGVEVSAEEEFRIGDVVTRGLRRGQ